MRIGLTIVAIVLFLTSCKDAKDTFVLSSSVGKSNQLLVVADANNWNGEVGEHLRKFLGKLVVGLPQPETTFNVTQIAPKGFGSMMNKYRSILIVQTAEKESFTIKKDFYAKPQTIIYVTAKDNEGLKKQLQKHQKEIVKTFRNADLLQIQQRFNAKRLDDSQYKTLQKLGVSLTIPSDFKTVDDTGEFLWLRQRLMSGITQGDGVNNILVYSVPISESFDLEVANTIIVNRNTIGKKYIPGSKEGMYMITEAAYVPQTKEIVLNQKQAFETRGKWEVKNDFMAGPFINFTVVDQKNNRLLVFEGFTYAPSINKRDFIFELEAIGKSMVIKE